MAGSPRRTITQREAHQTGHLAWGQTWPPPGGPEVPASPRCSVSGVPGFPSLGRGKRRRCRPAVPQCCLWLRRDGHIPVSLPTAGHCRLLNLARQTERLGLLEGQVCPRNKGFWARLLTTEEAGQTSSTAGISKHLTHCWNTDPDGWKLSLLAPWTSQLRPGLPWTGLMSLLAMGAQNPSFP